MGSHLYIYAIVGGRPGARAVSGLPTLPDGDQPRILALDEGISLIVADVSSDTYNESALQTRLTDLDWVARAGAAHHGVAEALAEQHEVLPLRLFTLFSSEAKALATLRKSKGRLAKALERVKGRDEWVLRIGKPDPARLSASESPAKPADRTGTGFLRRKADARREQAARTTRTAADAAAVFVALRELADDATTRPLEPGVNLLLDAAFLVPKRRTEAFQKKLSEAARGLLNDGCAVSLTGPWPPYSIATLD